MITKDHLTTIRYFWEEKGDIKRYCEWDKIKFALSQEYPEVFFAIMNYENSMIILTKILEKVTKDA